MPTIMEAMGGLLFAEPGCSAFAVLDGASIPELLDKLDELQPEYKCLRAGQLKPDIAEVVPYLVRLEQGSDFTRWLLDQGWGKHWGIFALATPNLIEMRHHFRTLTMVYAPEGKRVLFRFYDPRVLRKFLPTCNATELQSMFGPVTSYLAEAEDPGTALRFHLSAGKLVEQQKLLRLKED